MNPSPEKILTARWTRLDFHPEQQRLWASPARFKVVPAGRRSGKTELAKRRLVQAAMAGTSFARPRFFAAAPTRDQAKRIFWEDLNLLCPPRLKTGVNASDLIIRLAGRAEIHVVGLDRPERIEGSPWDGGVLDEFADLRPEAWPKHVRPALSDRQGWCWMIGVPEGRNHYYDLYHFALAEAARSRAEGRVPEWDAFHWTSAEILPAQEVAAYRRAVDEVTFRQEFEASFLNLAGRVYYAFDRTSHCAPLEYDPKRPLIFNLDFNVSPGVAVAAQEMTLPSGLEGTGVIGEVYIPRHANTVAVCRRLIQDWGGHQGPVLVYGDASGGAGGSAKVAGSDWDLAARELKGHFGERVRFRMPRRNPAERARVNAVNARLRNAAGEIRLMLDPARAPMTIRDLEGVRLLEGGSGQIDKAFDPMLTHLSDALGYYLVRQWPAGLIQTPVRPLWEG